MTMEYFVRYAKFWQSGVSTKSGWKVRIFATATEAHAFSQQMSLAGWSVEAGRFRDTRRRTYMEVSLHGSSSSSERFSVLGASPTESDEWGRFEANRVSPSLQ
jgi:hypothetical protein